MNHHPHVVFDYQAVSATLRGFHESDKLVRAVVGPVGSGRTFAALVELLSWSTSIPPDPQGRRLSRFLVARQTLTRLEQSTLRTGKVLWID